MGDNVIGTFVSEKINKIRWVTEEYAECNSFLTGSWDMEKNHLKFWTYKNTVEDSELYPQTEHELPFDGDVTEIQFVNKTSFVVSSTDGFVKQYRVSRSIGAASLVEQLSWDSLHSWGTEPAPCTSLAVFEGDIATVGEDGRINLLTSGQQQKVRTIENADSCTLMSVCFLKHNEVLTGNLRGQMKCWDLRAAGSTPSNTFMLSGEQAAATCITHHPTQRHIVLVGSEEGSLTVWDLRLATYPVSVLSAHSDTVAEIHFHPDQPSRLFTCSASGELWHWDAGKLGADGIAWLSSDTSKQKLHVYSLVPPLHKPINSLDLNRDRAICGCDNEAVYLVNDVYV